MKSEELKEVIVRTIDEIKVDMNKYLNSKIIKIKR
jgi:hypothetical protein